MKPLEPEETDEEFEGLEPLEEIELIFDSSEEPDEKQRLDNFVSKKVEELSRAQVQKLIEQESISLNGKPAKASQKLKDGDVIIIKTGPVEPLDLEPEDIALQVVYEDEFLIVVNKPAGMVTHPGAGVRNGTLVNALLFHCKGSLSGISGVERPGIVHRLDKDTSGLLVAAKEDFTHKNLSEQLAARTVKRIYLALVEGNVEGEEGTVDKPIGRHPTKRKEMKISEKGRHAVTHFAVIERYRNFTLLECKLETGRTHQIRVHMTSLGYPVVGDLVYNRKSTGSEKARTKLGLRGQALHATALTFIHPKTGETMKFNAPVPPDYQSIIDSLRE